MLNRQKTIKRSVRDAGRTAQDTGLAVFETLCRFVGHVPYITVQVTGHRPVRFYVVEGNRKSYYGYALSAEKTRSRYAGSTFGMSNIPREYCDGLRVFDPGLSERMRRAEHRKALKRAIADGFDFEALLVELEELPV